MRLWWVHVAGAAALVVLALVLVEAGAGVGAALAVMGPFGGLMFLGGFYYSERLRSQGKRRGAFGPGLPSEQRFGATESRSGGA